MVKKLFLLLLMLSFPASAYANTQANVNVKNNISSNSTSNVRSHTDITVETDGDVTHYESDEPGDVSVKSVNGVSEIKVNGKTVTSSPVSPTPKLTPEPTEKREDEDRLSSLKEFENKIVEQIKRPFRILRSIIFFWS